MTLMCLMGYSPLLHTPSFSNCFGACSALCMKYCSVSNYFTRAYGRGGSACRPPPGGNIGGYILSFSLSFSLLLFLLVLFFFFFSFSFSLSLLRSEVTRKLFGLRNFLFNIVGFVYLQCTCIFHKYRFRTNALYKTCITGAN